MTDMQKASALLSQLLDTYIGKDEAEKASVLFIQSMLAKHPDIWLSSCEQAHITGSGLILDRASKNVLLLYHRKLERWLPTGGHGEGEQDPSQIALREATEESGLVDLQFFPDSRRPTLIDVDAHLIPARQGKPEHYHLDFRYVFFTLSPEKIRLRQTEAQEVRWYSFSETRALHLSSSTQRLIQKAKRLLTRTDETNGEHS